MAITLSFVYLGSVGWPGLHWDAALYGPPVINVANGKGWLFGSYGPQVIQRSSLAYDFHGILHVFVYGVVFRSGTWARYLFAQGIVNAVTAASYAGLCLQILLKIHGLKFYSVVFSLLIGVVAGVICVGLQGRPEQLAPLVLCLPLMAILFISNRFSLSIALGVALALLTVLSPLVGVVFAVFALLYLFATAESGLFGYLQIASTMLGVAVVVSAGLVWMLTPFSPVDWCFNVFGASQSAVSFGGLLLKLSVLRFGFTLIAPGWNTVSLLLILAAGVSLWRARRSLLSMLVLGLAIAFFNNKMCDYSYAPFIPFGLLLCLRCLCESSRSPSHASTWWLKPLGVGAVMAASSYLLILASYLMVDIVIPRSELSPVSSRQRFADSQAGQELRSGTSAVGFPAFTWPSMVLLGDASSRYVSFKSTLQPSLDQSIEAYEAKTGSTVKWFVYPQTATRFNATPPSSIYVGKNRYALVDSQWVPPVPLDFRLKPAFLTNRYNVALYRRQG